MFSNVIIDVSQPMKIVRTSHLHKLVAQNVISSYGNIRGPNLKNQRGWRGVFFLQEVGYAREWSTEKSEIILRLRRP